MLLVAVMLFVPVYEAFACSVEPVAHAQDFDVASDASESGSETDHSHGLCGHNHCHHTTADLPDAIVLTDATEKCRLAWSLRDNGALSSAAYGPLRPPRI